MKYFDQIFHIQSCFDFINGVAPMNLVYYSHFTSIIVSLILGIVIFRNGSKSIVGRLLFALSLVFSLWVVTDLITWTSYDSRMYMFFWSFFGILTSLIYLISIYFAYAFIYERNLSFKVLTFFFLLLLPVIIFTPTTYNLTGFSNIDCNSIESPLFTNYFHSLGIFAFISILIISIRGYLKTKDKSLRRQIILMTIGIESFISVFFVATFLDSYLVSAGIANDYVIGNYGLFGIIIFMAFLTYLIVRFKAFDIKLVGAQALIISLIILIGSEFFFIQNDTNRILTAITLVITGVIGINLIRSVKKEVTQREHIEKLAGELGVANQRQEGLIHFISHEIKGYLAKNEAAFAGIVEGDYGTVSEETKTLAESALSDTRRGVTTVMDILNASNLKKGTTKFDMKPFDFKQALVNVVKNQTPAATAKGIIINSLFEDGTFEIMGDEKEIAGHVLNNLIDNAIKYTFKGAIDIALKRNNHKLLFSVKDSGIGITDDDKKRLFTEGGHGKDSTKTNVNSTGYGLYIAKQIVGAHKGRIWAESKGSGQGSTFFVELEMLK